MPDALTQGSGLLRARRILTMVPGLEGESLWWENGRIRGVGSASEMERAAPRGIPRLELPDALVTPGLVDGHTHLAMWALNRRRVELSGSLTREEVIARVAAARPLGGWIVGQGWNANGWLSPPHRLALDEVQQGPVYLDSLDVHAAWVNTPALAAAGITRDTPDPFGGRIVRDANGDPTGLLLERAVELMTPTLPEPSARALDDALRDAQAEAHRLGITGIHEVESMAVLDAFRRLDAAGELRLRVLFHPPVAALASLIAERRSEWTGVGMAEARRGEDVPRRQPRQPHRLDAGALCGHAGSRHADNRREGCARRRDRRRGCRHLQHGACDRRCGGAPGAGAAECWPPACRSRIASSTSSAYTPRTSTALLALVSFSPCSPRTCSPTSSWWSGTGGSAAEAPMRSARSSSGERDWCSGATCR